MICYCSAQRLQHIKSDLISIFIANNISIIAPIRKCELQMGIFSWIFHPSTHRTQVTLKNIHLNRKTGESHSNLTLNCSDDSNLFMVQYAFITSTVSTVTVVNKYIWARFILWFRLKILRVPAMSQIGLNCLSTQCAGKLIGLFY